MSYKLHPVRPGLTAIAAVLALSSTPLFAQEAAPVTVAPPTVVTPPTMTEAAPAPAATPAPVVAPTVQSTAPTSTASGSLVTVPIRPGGIAPELNVAPTTSAAVPGPQIETESRTAPVTRAAPAPAPRETAPATPVAAERSAPTAPVTPPVAEAAPIPTPPAPVAEAPVAAPAQATTTRTVQTDASDDILPIAGAAGAALILIGGGVFAMRRRRRDDGQVYVADTVIDTPVAPQPVAYAAPVVTPAVPPMAAKPILASGGPATAIPAGFDTSRFGRHTQAAYRGPTADNPFLSLKRRLKRASFMDQRERMATQGAAPVMQTAATAPVAKPAVAPRQTEHITTRIKSPARPGFRPAWQS